MLQGLTQNIVGSFAVVAVTGNKISSSLSEFGDLSTIATNSTAITVGGNGVVLLSGARFLVESNTISMFSPTTNCPLVAFRSSPPFTSTNGDPSSSSFSFSHNTLDLRTTTDSPESVCQTVNIIGAFNQLGRVTLSHNLINTNSSLVVLRAATVRMHLTGVLETSHNTYTRFAFDRPLHTSSSMLVISDLRLDAQSTWFLQFNKFLNNELPMPAVGSSSLRSMTQSSAVDIKSTARIHWCHNRMHGVNITVSNFIFGNQSAGRGDVTLLARQGRHDARFALRLSLRT